MGTTWIKILSVLLMFFLCLRNNYDAIYIREMPKNPGPRLLSKLFKIPLYIEINDLVVPALIERGDPSHLVRKVKKHQESDFKKASGLIIPSVPRRNWIINHYHIPEDRAHLIMNGADVCEVNILDRVQAKERLGLSANSFSMP